MYVFQAIVGLSIALAVVSGAAPSADMAVSDTKERLSDRAMEVLVEGPMAAVRSASLETGEREFQKLLDETRNRHGARSVEVADLLMAFGVGLFIEGMDSDEPAIGKASLRYLKAAVPAYSAAFGPNHVEVAVALASYADAEMQLQVGDPSPELETARQQAFDIRLAALGRAHVETRTSLRDLAAVKGHPSRVKGNTERLNAAVEMLESILVDAPDEPFYVSAPFIRMGIARLYALNGKSAEAVNHAEIAKCGANPRWDFTACFVFEAELGKIADALRQHGYVALADQLESPDPLAQILECGSGAKWDSKLSMQIGATAH